MLLYDAVVGVKDGRMGERKHKGTVQTETKKHFPGYSLRCTAAILKSAGGIAGYFQIKWEYKYIKEGMGLYELGCTYKR